MTSTENNNIDLDALRSELRAIPQGTLVEISSQEYKYQGRLNFTEAEIIEIGNAVEVTTNTHYHRMQDFVLSDISSVRVVESDMESALNKSDTKESNSKKKIAAELKLMEPVELMMETFVVRTPDQLKNLFKALREIDIVGVNLEGKNLGRFGKLTWVILCARKTIIPIDIRSLSAELPTFWGSLGRHIFENQHLVKIIHDCRPASDYLFHAHKIRLTNVFDTQVCDAVIRNVKEEQDYHQLHELLGIYNFRIPDVELEYLKKYLDIEAGLSESPWLTQPLPAPEFMKLAALRVKHLIPLRENLIKKILENFTDTVEARLNQRELALSSPASLKSTVCPDILESPNSQKEKPQNQEESERND